MMVMDLEDALRLEYPRGDLNELRARYGTSMDRIYKLGRKLGLRREIEQYTKRRPAGTAAAEPAKAKAQKPQLPTNRVAPQLPPPDWLHALWFARDTTRKESRGRRNS